MESSRMHAHEVNAANMPNYQPHQRSLPPPQLLLTELNPADIIVGVMLEDGFAPEEEVRSCGTMRETCPHCTGSHLQMVLRQKAVKLAHLFCPQCTRCYHACYEDGSPALALG